MQKSELKRGSIGFWGVVFLSIVAIFPGNIYIISSTTALTYAGQAAPLTFIIGTALMFLNVVAVYVFSTKIINAGGFYKFIEGATGNGFLSRSVAWIQFLAQMCPVIISATVFGWLIPVTASALFNTTLPTYVPFLASLLVLIYVFIISYLGIRLSARVSIGVGLAEIIFVLIAGIYIVSHTAYNSLGAFNIANSSQGLTGFFVGMVTGPLTAYIGYSSVVHFSEEAKFSKSLMKRAIVVSILIAALFETFMMYSISVGAPPSSLQSLSGSYAPALVLTSQYMGLAFALVVLIVALIGQITSPLTFGNSAARVVFALGRDKVLPASFSRIHPKYGTPHISTLFVFIFAVVASLITQFVMVAGYGVLSGFFDVVVFWAIILTVMNLLYHAIVNETLPLLMHRFKELNVIKHVVVPTVGTVTIGIIFYYTLLGIAPPIAYDIPLMVVWILLGFVIAFRKRAVPVVEADIPEA
ncbi:MAG TPA: APC family permease [Thermoplasmataceae archaeon]|nr:APC family permease [Thermoplasmataceae archaeon]